MKLFIAAFLFILHVFCANNENSAIDILWEESFTYNTSHKIESIVPEEVHRYHKIFTTVSDYKFLSVELRIPYIGEVAGGWKAMTYLDNVLIFVTGNYQTFQCLLEPITIIKGYKTDVKKGRHDIRVYVATSQTYNLFPGYFPSSIESWDPRISSKLLIVGYKDVVSTETNLVDTLYEEKVSYYSPIVVPKHTYTKITQFSRNFTTSIDYKLVYIDIVIPGVTANAVNYRLRIFIKLDDEFISDWTSYDSFPNNVLTALLKGHKTNLKSGRHMVRVYALTDAATAQVHTYSSGGTESSEPREYGTIHIYGYK